jgi:protein-disulfide isomerase
MASPETQATLEKDIELAHHIYLNGTPSVIVNKRVLKLWRIPEFLRAVVEEEIKRRK